MADVGEAKTLEPVRKKLVVPASPEVAFRRFTAEIESWWPLGAYSIHGDGGSVEFGAAAGERIVERGPEGGEGEWGTITEWDPPRRVAFTWHPGRDPESAQEVAVTFASTGEGTEVTLVHGGWEKFGEGAAEAREGYGAGWARVLEAYRAAL